MSDTDTVLVTGATSGIGAETALQLADQGWTVYVHGRNRDRGTDIADQASQRSGDATFLEADFATKHGVEDLATQIRSETDSLSALVHNAGVLTDECRLAWDGIEEMFAVNHLAPYLLTHELLGHLERGDRSRVVFTSSTMHTRGTFDYTDSDDLDCSTEVGSTTLYGRSKLANLAFAMELADRFDDADVGVTAIHPGFVPGGDIYRHYGTLAQAAITIAATVPMLGTSVEDAAAAMVALTAGDVGAAETGSYFDGLETAPPDDRVHDPENRELVWSMSADVTGVDPDWP